MEGLEELMNHWKKGSHVQESDMLDKTAWQSLIKKRTTKQKNKSIHYFWAAFLYQLIVYSILSYLIISHWEDKLLVMICVICELLYLPFTIVLIEKFRRLAVLAPNKNDLSGLSLGEYVSRHHQIIKGFLRFKSLYELFLIPVTSAIFVWIFFRIYMPGGVSSYPLASVIVFLLVAGACTAAIVLENKRNFKTPIKELEKVLDDIKEKE